jgi:hypothetical protein
MHTLNNYRCNWWHSYWPNLDKHLKRLRQACQEVLESVSMRAIFFTFSLPLIPVDELSWAALEDGSFVMAELFDVLDYDPDVKAHAVRFEISNPWVEDAAEFCSLHIHGLVIGPDLTASRVRKLLEGHRWSSHEKVWAEVADNPMKCASYITKDPQRDKWRMTSRPFASKAAQRRVAKMRKNYHEESVASKIAKRGGIFDRRTLRPFLEAQLRARLRCLERAGATRRFFRLAMLGRGTDDDKLASQGDNGNRVISAITHQLAKQSDEPSKGGEGSETQASTEGAA